MLPADMRKTDEGRAVGHGQGQLKAAKGSHVGGVIRVVPQQEPVQQTKPDSMPKDDGRIWQGLHVHHERTHAGFKLGKGFSVDAHAAQRIGIIPITLYKGLALGAIESGYQGRVDH